MFTTQQERQTAKGMYIFLNYCKYEIFGGAVAVGIRGLIASESEDKKFHATAITPSLVC